MVSKTTTEPRNVRAGRAPARRPTFVGGWPLMLATALSIFVCVFALLAWRVRDGLDPVLGASAQPAVVKSQPRKIKRIIVVRRVVVTELPPRASATAVSGTGGGYTAPTQSYSPQSSSPQSSSPPATSAPAAPAPAPQPVTRSS